MRRPSTHFFSSFNWDEMSGVQSERRAAPERSAAPTRLPGASPLILSKGKYADRIRPYGSIRERDNDGVDMGALREILRPTC